MAREPMPGVQAVLATPHARQIYSGMVPGWIAGHYTLDECAIPLEPLARAAKVELALARGGVVDAQERTVTLADGRVAEYDVLSLDTGAAFDRDAIRGAREHGLFLRPMRALRAAVRSRAGAARADRVLDIVVIGGGAAGFEVALARAPSAATARRRARARVPGDRRRQRAAELRRQGAPACGGLPCGARASR